MFNIFNTNSLKIVLVAQCIIVTAPVPWFGGLGTQGLGLVNSEKGSFWRVWSVVWGLGTQGLRLVNSEKGLFWRELIVLWSFLGLKWSGRGWYARKGQVFTNKVDIKFRHSYYLASFSLTTPVMSSRSASMWLAPAWRSLVLCSTDCNSVLYLNSQRN